MAKFYGSVGFVTQPENSPGIATLKAVERTYYGDELKVARRWEKTDHLNDDLNAVITISIVADRFAYDNIAAIRYVSWMGSRWNVTSVEPQRPRLLLTIGGVYNGPTP